MPGIAGGCHLPPGAHHTSGIGELTETEAKRIRSNEDALRIIGDKNRLFEPGEAGRIASSTAYSLLTATAELITGEPLAELERKRLYEPAGMDDTGLDGFDGPPRGSAVGCRALGGNPSGDSVGNWSTVDDLWAWHRPLLANDLIPFRFLALMERPAVPVEGALWYGYGVEVRETYGRREISHRGGTDGFSSYSSGFRTMTSSSFCCQIANRPTLTRCESGSSTSSFRRRAEADRCDRVVEPSVLWR